MDCPLCGSQLEEQYKRIPLTHPFGKHMNTLRNKTKKARVYYCQSCRKYFARTTTLKEVEIVG